MRNSENPGSFGEFRASFLTELTDEEAVGLYSRALTQFRTSSQSREEPTGTNVNALLDSVGIKE